MRPKQAQTLVKVSLTISKENYGWLQSTAKHHGISVSNLLRAALNFMMTIDKTKLKLQPEKLEPCE